MKMRSDLGARFIDIESTDNRVSGNRADLSKRCSTRRLDLEASYQPIDMGSRHWVD